MKMVYIYQISESISFSRLHQTDDECLPRLDQQVLLSSQDSLLSLVVLELSRRQVGWSTTLGEENSSLGSSVLVEPRSRLHSDSDYY